MAGSSTDFDVDDVRGNLRAVMLMGLPNDEALRPVFHFPTHVSYAHRDMAGKPWDFNEPAIPPDDPDKDDLTCGDGASQIACSYTEVGRQVQGTQAPMGPLDRQVYEFTFLDVDYDKVAGFESVTIGDTTYQYRETLPPDGLHDLTVHTVIVGAEDAA